jgi:hypothetical protein
MCFTEIHIKHKICDFLITTKLHIIYQIYQNSHNLFFFLSHILLRCAAIFIHHRRSQNFFISHIIYLIAPQKIIGPAFLILRRDRQHVSHKRSKYHQRKNHMTVISAGAPCQNLTYIGKTKLLTTNLSNLVNGQEFGAVYQIRLPQRNLKKMSRNGRH